MVACEGFPVISQFSVSCTKAEGDFSLKMYIAAETQVFGTQWLR